MPDAKSAAETVRALVSRAQAAQQAYAGREPTRGGLRYRSSAYSLSAARAVAAGA